MSYEFLTFNTDDRGVATITLNRPQVHNALNAGLIKELQMVCHEINDSTYIRVVVLTGTEVSFCAGGDLRWMESNINKSREQRMEETGELATTLSMLNSLTKPLIGRVQGPAYGGGVGMISVCDFAIGVNTATFGLTEVKLGLTPATISPYVVKRIGERNARRNFFNARIFKADEAIRMGLLSDVVEADDLDDAIEREVKLILKCAPGAIASAKKLIAYVDSHNAAENTIYTVNNLADAWETTEGIDGIDAFLNKRKAPWM
ncbi:MAG: enoyl-CoA hydratase [Cycloclasticus sp. symbiont of Bathymodiolus heckerae]|nr:MAG: enoyl-CoA hydratase [Cycloclasticus sp. symbiont of Bathymodiolus heckerae]